MYHILMLCVMSVYLHAVDEQAVFAQACTTYQEGQFAVAEEQFLRITDKTPSVWYNAGNAAYQAEAYGKAMLYWMRAARNADARIYRNVMHNIAYLRERLGYADTARDHISYFCKLMIRYVPLLLMQLMLILLWIFTIWLMQHKLLRRSFLLCISLLSILILFMTWICRSENDLAVVIAKNTSVYAGPNSSFYQLATLREAEVVTLLSESPSWNKILYGELIGWVAHSQVASIDYV